MKRVIVNYSKLTADILDLLIEKYPDGYDYTDIIKFQNSKTSIVPALNIASPRCTSLKNREIIN